MNSNPNIVKEDRVSKLPDELLCHILSHFTTNWVVKTSILSKRWRYIWTSVPNLVLNDYDRMVNDYIKPIRIKNKSQFINFCNRVLDLNNVTSIQKFSITLREDYDLFCISRWIKAALTRDVEQITLKFINGELVKLPRTFFAIKKLVLLDLGWRIAMIVPEIVDFPNLKEIRLNEVHFVDDDSMKRLLLGCPMLEDLTIAIAKQAWDNIGILHVSSSSLKKFLLSIIFPCEGHLKCKVVIDTPNLESFRLIHFGRGSNHFEVNISALALISVYLHLAPYNKIMELLTNVSNTKYLSLSKLAFEPFIKYKKIHNLPVFGSLNTLEVTVKEGCWEFFHHLLECSPNLHILILKMSGNYEWSPPRSIPRCLQISLKEIVIGVFHGSDANTIIAKFFLENGKVLKKMSLGFLCPGEKPISDMTKKEISISKASSECEVNFYYGKRVIGRIGAPINMLIDPNGILDPYKVLPSFSSPIVDKLFHEAVY